MCRPVRLSAWLGRTESLNQLTRSGQHGGRERDSECLRGIQVDHYLERGGVFNGEIGGVGAFRDLVGVAGRSSPEFGEVRAIRHQCAGIDGLAEAANRWHTMLRPELADSRLLSYGDRKYVQGARRCFSHGCQSSAEIVRWPDSHWHNRHTFRLRGGPDILEFWRVVN